MLLVEQVRKHISEQLLQRNEAEITSDLSIALAPYGVEVQGVSLANLDFSDEFDAEIESKVKAQQEAQRAVIELETAQAEAAQTIARAEGKAQATLLQAQAEAESLKIKAEVLDSSPDLVRLIEAERWDGARAKVEVTGGAPLMYNLPAPE